MPHSSQVQLAGGREKRVCSIGQPGPRPMEAPTPPTPTSGVALNVEVQSAERGREREGRFLWIRPRNASHTVCPCPICQQPIVWLGQGIRLRAWEDRAPMAAHAASDGASPLEPSALGRQEALSESDGLLSEQKTLSVFPAMRV